jgi:type I restriction enzyme M protein
MLILNLGIMKEKLRDEIFENVWILLDKYREILIPDEYPVILYLCFLLNKDIPISCLKSDQEILNLFSSNNPLLSQKVVRYFSPIVGRLNDRLLNEVASISAVVNKNYDDFLVFTDDFVRSLSINFGRTFGEYYQPEELTNFIVGISESSDKSNIYNPFAGVASFGAKLNANYLGQEINISIWAIGALRMLIKGGNADIVHGDSINNWNPYGKTYDIIIANPPFGNLSGRIRGNYGNIKSFAHFLIEKGINSLTSGGKLIAVVPENLLFSLENENNLRHELIKQDLVETVISFPSGVLHNNSAPFSVVVLNKNKRFPARVKLVNSELYLVNSDARSLRINSEKLISAVFSEDEQPGTIFVENSLIAEVNFRLTVKRYFQKEVEGMRLGNFTEGIRFLRARDGEQGRVLRIKDLKSEKFNHILNIDDLPVEVVSSNFKRVSESCLLLSRFVKNLKPTWFNFTGEAIFVPPGIYTLKVSEAVEVSYLIHELHSANVQEQLKNLCSGSAMPVIFLIDLAEIKINLLENTQEQRQVLEKYKQEYRASRNRELGLYDEIERIKNEQRQDLSIKKNNILQHLNNVKESAELLKKIMLLNRRMLNLDYAINPSSGSSIENRIYKLIQSINDSLFYVENITNEIDHTETDDFPVKELILEAKERGRYNPELFEVQFHYDRSSFEVLFPEEDMLNEIEPVIKISKNKFFEIYNNLLENAVIHGFTEKNKKYIFKIELSGSLDFGEFMISFSNNGDPFPEGIAERYHIKGEKAGLNANRGLGSWVVTENVRLFKGNYKVHDLRNEEFPVRIDLVFPFANQTYLYEQKNIVDL